MTETQSHVGAVTVSLSVSVVLLVSAIVGLVAWRTIYKSETATLLLLTCADTMSAVRVINVSPKLS